MARHTITTAASQKGRALKTEKAQALLWEVYHALRAIARAEGIAPTLKGIAEQLNRRGLRTNRGNEFDFRKVGAALNGLGVDRVAIERWRQLARDKAMLWEVQPQALYRQLWFEWQRHVVMSADPFVPNLVHPRDWVPPWEKAQRPDWRFVHPPPQARIVHLFFGAFDEDSEGW